METLSIDQVNALLVDYINQLYQTRRSKELAHRTYAALVCLGLGSQAVRK